MTHRFMHTQTPNGRSIKTTRAQIVPVDIPAILADPFLLVVTEPEDAGGGWLEDVNTAEAENRGIIIVMNKSCSWTSKISPPK